MTGKNKDNLLKEAIKRCRLNAETVQMAKRLGLDPESLIKTIPNKSQGWKKPVYLWIRDMYYDRFGESIRPSGKNKDAY
jgi:hypothetical protein